MAIKYPCLVCNRAVAKNYKAFQCDCCDRWVHIARNYLNVYIYRKLQKDKSPWYCLYCLKRKMPFCSLKNEHLKEFFYLIFLSFFILSPNKKIITNAIRQNEITDERLLRRANNKFFTPNEFNHALKDLVNRKYALYMHLNVPSLS